MLWSNAGNTSPRMSATAENQRHFQPGRSYSYWPYTVVFIAGWIVIIWSMGVFERYRVESLSQYLERARIILLVTGLIPLIGLAFLLLPLRRTALTVRPEGLEVEPVKRGQRFTIRWSDIARIERRGAHRGPDYLFFHLRKGNQTGFRQRYKLPQDVFEGSFIELLTAIRDIAPMAGYQLKGHRLDIRHMGGEQWWFEPLETAEE